MADDEQEDDTTGSAINISNDFKVEDFFHGPMSQSNADKLLSEYEPNNYFLVRKRISTPGVEQPDPESTFCISLFTMSKSGASKVHFRIRQSYDLWIIGGRVFHSLGSLIGYYRVHEILPGATLQHPIPPRRQLRPQSLVMTTLSYSKSPDTAEISFTAGDVCMVDHRNQDGWLWVTHVRTNEIGFVYEAMVEELASPNYDPDLESCEFYHPGRREELLEQLKLKPTGTFFLRPSAKSPSISVLCVNCTGAIKKFEIEKSTNNSGQFILSGRCFNSMAEIIARYSSTYIDNDNKVLLTYPMLKRSQDANLPADDIYAESRSAQLLSRESQLTGELHCLVVKRRSRQNRAWKRQLCTLQRRESGKHEVLLMPLEAGGGRRKPKELIDLEFAHLFPMCEGTHPDRPHCLQLVICDRHGAAAPAAAAATSSAAVPPDVYVLAADTQQQLASWTSALKPVCHVGCGSGGVGACSPGFKRVSTLEVRNLGVRNLGPSTRSAWVTVLFNGVLVARTRTNKRDQDDESLINWDESFHFEFFPECVSTISLHLHCAKAKSAPKVVKHDVTVASLKLGCTADFKLPQSDAKAQLCCSIRRVSHPVLQASKDYVPIRDIVLVPVESLTQQVPECLRALGEVCQSEDLPHLARSVYKVFAYHGRGAELLTALLLSDIAAVKSEEDCVLFRTRTMGTAALEVYLETEEPVMFVRNCLGTMVEEIVRNNCSLELKTDRLLQSSGDLADHEEAELTAAKNAQRLSELLLACVCRTLQHCRAGGCPAVLRAVSAVCQRETVRRFPQATSRVLSAFYFLRLFCPALTTKFRLVFGPQLHQEASPQVVRSLQLAAKTLQLFANQTRAFRESCMEKVKGFVCDNADLLAELNACLTGPESPAEKQHRVHLSGDAQQGQKSGISLTFELASLHDYCAHHLNELRQLLQESLDRRCPMQELKKLISATEFLSAKLAPGVQQTQQQQRLLRE